MRRNATVVSIEPSHSASGDATHVVCVELHDVGQCRRCSRGEGCGAAIFSGSVSGAGSNKAQLKLLVSSLKPLTAGQQVVIDIDDNAGSTWLWAVFGAYGLPLAGMLLATGLASATVTTGADPASSGSELTIILSAVAGLVAGLLAWRVSSRRLLPLIERGLCLSSARISTDTGSPTTRHLIQHRK